MDTTPLQRMFGKVVRLRRIGLGLSQEDLAGRAGLHVTHISSLERGLANLTLQTLERLAATLGKPLSSLIAEAEYRLQIEAENESGERRRRAKSSSGTSNS